MVGHHHRTQYGFIDGEVNLTCEADGNPKPEFIWYRDGKKVNGAHTENYMSVLNVRLWFFCASVFHP